jgi:N-acetylated-alpha-linked acidic dipeptidase
MTMTDIQTLCSKVSAAGMFAHLEEFAKRVKLSGTPEELESFRYLQRQLDGMGFATTLIQHDAYISLPGAARLEAGPETPACITHSFSRPSGPQGVSGELIYLGFGTEQDFQGRDLRGKIVLVDGLASPAVSLRASRANAVGQVHVSAHQHKHEMCISPVWGSPTHEAVGQLPQTVVLTVAKADGERLKERVARGEAAVTLYAEVDTGWRKTPLLVAELAAAPGDADEPFVMFSGHHDTWYYGVIDNGGANATMLEVARIVSAHRNEWRRGLRLCFWSGHSHGRYSGSAWYAEQYWRELARRCAVHVNVDSTGARGNTILADMPASAELRAVGAEAVLAQGGQELTGLRVGRAGDQSFWGIGIPSLFMTAGEQPLGDAIDIQGGVLGSSGGRKGAGFGWWWHTPDDTLDKMDRDLLVRDTRVYVHAIWRLLTDDAIALDYGAYADALLLELAALDQSRLGEIRIGELVSATGELKARFRSLQETLASHAGPVPAAFTVALMRVSRALVPIDYTTGNRFGQDPALGQKPYPVLDPIRRLAAAAADSDEACFCAVAARRARNQVMHALDEAMLALESCFAALKHPAA